MVSSNLLAAEDPISLSDFALYLLSDLTKSALRRRPEGADAGLWNMLDFPNRDADQLNSSLVEAHTFGGPTRRVGFAPGTVPHANFGSAPYPDYGALAQRYKRPNDIRTPTGMSGRTSLPSPYSPDTFRTPSATASSSTLLICAPQSNGGDSGDSTLGSPSAGPRAKLELHGDLSEMAVGWSVDEWQSGRRLVQFWRKQEGTTIHATFQKILPSQYVPNSIVVSCIFREERNECFITSVDTIYLLEALIAVRFTIEEKNRIRRNLEGFRPETVSKKKRGTEAFFKRIISFPDPKPRNIEKDVKAFPWKILAPALQKVVNKYIGHQSTGFSSSVGHSRSDSGNSEMSLSITGL